MKTHLCTWQRFAAPLVLALSVNAAHAQVTQLAVTERATAYGGRSFGTVGTYERITAKAAIALDPTDRRNAIIADIALAPRNSAGKVEISADVVILRPTDTAKGNRTLLIDVPNRGQKLAPQLFDDVAQPGANRAQSADDAGIGFLQRQGYTLVWVGWQGNLPSTPLQLAMQTPTVAGIKGAVREEFQFDHLNPTVTTALITPLADPQSLRVTVRALWWHERQTPPGLSVKATGPQTVEITRPSGFDAGALYELTYLGQDPLLLGAGYAVTRDVVSFLRHDTSSANPLAAAGGPAIERSIGFGVSQSGRYLRDFLWQGFNEDLQGRKVFEGLMPHVAGARRMATNVRFGQPNRNARHPQDPAWQADEFPFTYAVMTDPLSGKTDGLLKRCQGTQTCPLIIQTDSEHEWWGSRASLLVTDPVGNHIDLPPSVRAYMMTGTPHYTNPGETPKKTASMALPSNPMHAGPPMRALLTALQAWITTGTEPPASRVPMVAHGTLVAAERALPHAFPAMPFQGIFTPAAHSDHSTVPPKLIGNYSVGVPLADEDGMAVAGVRQLALMAPRASYTGWNPRANGFGPGMLFPLQGAAVPLVNTRAERLAAQDPRRSIEERYPTADDYVKAVQRAANQLVTERLLLPEDATRGVQRAKAGQLAQLN